MGAEVVRNDTPGSWTTFTFRKLRLTARTDPMSLGEQALREWAENPHIIRRLLTEDSLLDYSFHDVRGEYLVDLLETYLDAVGLSFQRLSLVIYALDHLDELEVDLLRLGLDVRDWLSPDGDLSTRRVALLIEDFRLRPETRLGALHMNILPLAKDGVVLAQIAAGLGGGDKHQFLKTPDEIAEEAAQLRRTAEKRKRIESQSIGAVLSQQGTVEDFEEARAESKKALAAIMAAQKE